MPIDYNTSIIDYNTMSSAELSEFFDSLSKAATTAEDALLDMSDAFDQIYGGQLRYIAATTVSFGPTVEVPIVARGRRAIALD